GPAAADGNARVDILARPSSSTGAYSVIGSQTLGAGTAAFAVNAKLASGTWTVQARYEDPGLVAAGASATANVTIPSTTGAAVTVNKQKVKNGTITLS